MKFKKRKQIDMFRPLECVKHCAAACIEDEFVYLFTVSGSSLGALPAFLVFSNRLVFTVSFLLLLACVQ
ncbi:hypothetical protein XELAEV_18000435mg [Xenopus laevis]|uniref:Uncharacterized protein n=1 Tax=Xenopus laevis TaxID=8355 RepID=A0A974BNY9_XENLA|nr:hypothetical protein XELAEV_18000435mg [Xenopus laevis]